MHCSLSVCLIALKLENERQYKVERSHLVVVYSMWQMYLTVPFLNQTVGLLVYHALQSSGMWCAIADE